MSRVATLKGRSFAGFPFRKDFPYMPTVNYHLVKIRQSGLQHYLHRFLLEMGPSRDHACLDEGGGGRADGRWEAGMNQVNGFFLVLVAGLSVSLAVAALECACTRSWTVKIRSGRDVDNYLSR